MELKTKRLIYCLLGTIFLVLDFVMLYLYYINYTKENDPYEIEPKVKAYMKEHHLNQSDYNFHKVLWGNKSDLPIIVQFFGIVIWILLNIVYMITAVFSFAFYMMGLPQEKLCPFITAIIIAAYQIFGSIVDLCIAFAHETLTEKDLSDFGELNDIINETYDLYIHAKLIMKLSAFYLLISPIFFTVTSFIEICNMSKNKNKNILVQPMAQPIMQYGYGYGVPPNSQYNPNANYPLMVQQVPQVNNLYSETNDATNEKNKTNNQPEQI